MTLTHKMSSKSSLKYSSSTMKIQARISTRSLVQRGAPKNHEILAVTAPTKLAELGQIPDQKTTTKSTEIRDIFNSLDVRHGTIQDDVVITPSYMEFKDASEGMVFRQSMTIRNIGKMPALVRICEPNSIALKIKSQRKGVILCPGLVLTRWVTYTFKRPALLHATIPIEINARTLNYRIVCSLSTEFIAIDPPSLDFGTVDIGCTSSTKIITISNIGGKSTRFTVDLGKNEKEMNVKPRRGLARPYSKIQLHVEIVGVVEGDFCGEFWIKSSPNIGVPVKVKVIVPRLVVHYPNSTGDFTLVDFPPTFMNARRYDSLVLRNISSRVTSYVVLAEIGNKLVPLKDVDHVENPAYSVFKINAMEGRLEPFEGRILNIEFSPTAKAARKPTVASTSGSREFIAFVRVLRVHCTEIEDIIKAEAKTEPSADYPPPKKIHIQEDAKSNSTVVEFAMSSPGRIAMETVRLCVHGEYESAKLCFTPDEIYLENFEYGATEKRVVRIQNPSRSNAVKFRFVDNGNAHTQPSEGWLDPGKAVEILVTIGAKRTWVENKVKLGFDVIARSCSARASRQQIDVKVATFYLNCYVNYREQKSTKTVEKIISDRYSPEPDYTMTFTEEERATEKNHKQYWANYLRTLHNREMRLADSEKLRSKCDCFEDLDEFLLNALEVPKSKNFRTLDAQLQCEPAEGKLSKEKKDKTLIPLSPLQIYNVKVSPTMLVFGSVVMKSLDYRELRFENKNSFSVKMRLLSFSRKNLRFPTGDTIILNPDTVTKKLVEFWAEQTGRFNGYIDYVINDHHPFELTVTADVVYKSLTLGAREVVLGSEEYHALGESYRPLSGRVEVKNKLNARTHFKWSVPASAGFVVSPRTGYVRGRRNLYVSIAYVGDTPKSQNSEAIIVTEGGTYMTLKMSTVLPVPDVAFLNDTLNVGLIPLNVPYAAVGVLHNAGYNEVIFEVNQASVGHGWFVYPMRGIIPPRGIALVEVQLRFEVCLNFAIFVEVTIHKGPKLRLKITGEVSFPMLKLSPRNITTPRMSADGSQSYHLSATNFGKTLLTLSFPLENYPEFRVSLSATQQPLSLESQGIIVLPGNTRSLYLHFKPVDLTSYAFYLPVVVNEILGPAVVENPKSLDPQEYLSPNEGWFIGSKNMNIVQPPSTLPTVFIDCTVTAYLLAFNKLTFNLDATTGELEDVLRVNNKATKDTSFIIRIDELIEKNCPFTIQHVRGAQADFVGVSIVCTLQPGASVEFRIKFNPQGRHDDFSVEAPIFVRGELDGGVFSTLRLEGRNPKCSIVSDTLEIYFRPLPLKVEAEEKFELLATNFIKCSKITVDVVEPDRLVGEFRENLLTVTFPRGSTIEGNIKRSEVIEVCLAFSSESPVSFRAKLRFHDAKNVASFIVTVFATADNCLLTIHSYLRSSSSGCKKNRFKLWDSSHPSLESQVSENCSLDKEFSGGKERRFIYAKPRLSAHSTASQSSWNASKIFNSMRVKPSASKYPNDEEDDEELEVTSRFDGSEMSASSRRPSKTFRVSGFSFPFFPACAREEQVEYEQHMKKTLKAAEEWLYSDPLRYQFYPHLVDGMTAVFSSLWTRKTRRRKKGDSHTVTQSFVNVLVAIVGPEVYEFIGRPPSLPDDDAMRVSQILKIYENILNFLIAQGASLCHVSSHYLLNYVDYVTTFDDPKFLRLISKSSLGDELAHSNRMSSSYLFDARSKQCWLDVILQTFKCLVLKRVTADGLREEFCDGLSGNASSTNRLSLVNPLTVTATAIIEDRARANQNYSHQEALLLAWLDYNYEEQRRKDWATNRTYDPSPIESMDVLPERSISNFEDDLSDSLALIAVTVAYCPFLVDEFFTNLYSQPKSTEEVLHNAICVVSAWRKIRLGFMITPREIVRPNCVQMLMLAVHLFETLPTYFPRTKVSFSCCLTETVTRTLNLTNPTDSSVTYVLQIFGNDSALFSTVNSEKTLKLSPRGSGSVNIKFHSRKISRTRSFLLLCGSAMGPNFARNQCFLLEGEATRLGVVKEYKVTSELYNVVDKALSIQVPYDYATNYEIWMSEEMPTKPATIKMERWSDMRLRKVPRRLFLNQTSIIVLEDRREADLSITIACIAPNHRNFWLVFKAKIGDFVIQISSSSEVSITDSITVEWEREACACSDPQTNVVSSCPLNLSVNIPARNVPMWDCVSHMFQKTLNAREQLFWSRHFDTNIGLRLIRRLMGDDSDYTAQEFRHLFESRVTYNVSTSDKSSRLKTAEKLTISDVKLSGEFVEMKIHVDELTPQAYETTLSLESLDGCEKRIYSVDFLCNIPSRSSTSG